MSFSKVKFYTLPFQKRVQKYLDVNLANYLGSKITWVAETVFDADSKKMSKNVFNGNLHTS